MVTSGIKSFILVIVSADLWHRFDVPVRKLPSDGKYVTFCSYI